MKLFFSVFLIILFFSQSIKAQSTVDFGLKGGLNFTFFKVTEENFGSNPDVGLGFYGGVFTDIKIDDKLSIQPEVLFIVLNDFKFLNAPIYVKYEIVDRFYILIGPSMNYFFDFFSNKFKVRADLSVSYQLTKKLDMHMKYSLGFEEITPNGIFLGVDFRL